MTEANAVEATHLYSTLLSVRLPVLQNLLVDANEDRDKVGDIAVGIPVFGRTSVRTAVWHLQDEEDHHIYVPDNLHGVLRQTRGRGPRRSTYMQTRWWREVIQHVVEDIMPELSDEEGRSKAIIDAAENVFLCLGDKRYDRIGSCGSSGLLYESEETSMRKALERAGKSYLHAFGKGDRYPIRDEAQGMIGWWLANNVGVYLQDITNGLTPDLNQAVKSD